MFQKPNFKISVTLSMHVLVILASGGPRLDNKAYASVLLANNETDFEIALDNAQPGDEVVLKNGTYTHFRVNKSIHGQTGKPIIIRAESPGGVKLTGESGFELDGSYWVLRDFYFDRAQSASTGANFNAVDIKGDYCKVLNNYFYKSGMTDAPGKGIIHLRSRAQYNQVAYNTFEDNISTAILFSSQGSPKESSHNRIEYNKFINTRWVGEVHPGLTNGMEIIKVGSGKYDKRLTKLDTTIQYNYFENVIGDIWELISVKTSNNKILYNTFYNCPGRITLRYGHGTTVTGNFFINDIPGLSNNGGVRIYGSNHVITNNYFYGMKDFAILLGGDRGEHYDRAIDIIVANNTMINTEKNAIEIGRKGLSKTDQPLRPKFYNNLIVQNQGTAIFKHGATNEEYYTNYLILSGTAFLGIDPATTSGIHTNINPSMAKINGFYRPTNAGLVDKGTALMEVSKDIDGKARVGLPDVGADEGVAAPDEPVPGQYIGPHNTGAQWLVKP